MVSDKKEQKFKRIAPKRLATFKLSADRLSKCLNKTYFDFTEKEKRYIIDEINKKVNKLFND